MIEIFDRKSLSGMLKLHPKIYDCIIITEPDTREESSYLFELCNNYLDLVFEDSISDTKNGPKIEDISKALVWAKDKEHIVVSCMAGISRSSAVAYLIACQRFGAQEAIKILNIRKHHPNILILKHGKELLGQEVWDVGIEFIQKAEGTIDIL